jgi:hypothetical protein
MRTSIQAINSIQLSSSSQRKFGSAFVVIVVKAKICSIQLVSQVRFNRRQHWRNQSYNRFGLAHVVLAARVRFSSGRNRYNSRSWFNSVVVMVAATSLARAAKKVIEK